MAVVGGMKKYDIVIESVIMNISRYDENELRENIWPPTFNGTSTTFLSYPNDSMYNDFGKNYVIDISHSWKCIKRIHHLLWQIKYKAEFRIMIFIIYQNMVQVFKYTR
ncbi:hypothetical protein WN51_03205 [Melipona quadrifasciata]|uniref:Uncharacterized protein n=1 Tax=Melipona quadrifasciata TaxID=166423 RepID=A0A0N0U4C0_9HYME|nr:hypothetical protein WN51_03205 [Melipona quadrifasciata]